MLVDMLLYRTYIYMIFLSFHFSDGANLMPNPMLQEESQELQEIVVDKQPAEVEYQLMNDLLLFVICKALVTKVLYNVHVTLPKKPEVTDLVLHQSNLRQDHPSFALHLVHCTPEKRLGTSLEFLANALKEHKQLFMNEWTKSKLLYIYRI